MNQKKGSLIEESLEVLRDKTLAIDADIMLKKVNANPKKSLQDGHCALDMSVQLGIVKIIETFRYADLRLIQITGGNSALISSSSSMA